MKATVFRTPAGDLVVERFGEELREGRRLRWGEIPQTVAELLRKSDDEVLELFRARCQKETTRLANHVSCAQHRARERVIVRRYGGGWIDEHGWIHEGPSMDERRRSERERRKVEAERIERECKPEGEALAGLWQAAETAGKAGAGVLGAPLGRTRR